MPMLRGGETDGGGASVGAALRVALADPASWLTMAPLAWLVVVVVVATLGAEAEALLDRSCAAVVGDCETL